MDFESKFQAWAQTVDHQFVARQHFQGRGWRVYIRRSRRRTIDSSITSPKHIYAWDLASVDVAPRYRKLGYFKTMLDVLEKHADATGTAVLVENILSDFVLATVQKRGYVVYDGNDEFGPTYIRYPACPVLVPTRPVLVPITAV